MSTNNINMIISSPKSTNSIEDDFQNTSSDVGFQNLDDEMQQLNHESISTFLDDKENTANIHPSSLIESKYKETFLTPVVMSRVKSMQIPVTTPMTCLKRLSRLSSPESQNSPSPIDKQSFESSILDPINSSNIDSFMEEHFQTSQKMSFKRRQLINNLTKPLSDDVIEIPTKVSKESAPFIMIQEESIHSKITKRFGNAIKMSLLVLFVIFSLFLIDLAFCITFALWSKDIEFMIVMSSSYYCYYSYYINHGLLTGLIRCILSHTLYEYDRSIPY